MKELNFGWPWEKRISQTKEDKEVMSYGNCFCFPFKFYQCLDAHWKYCILISNQKIPTGLCYRRTGSFVNFCFGMLRALRVWKLGMRQNYTTVAETAKVSLATGMCWRPGPFPILAPYILGQSVIQSH